MKPIYLRFMKILIILLSLWLSISKGQTNHNSNDATRGTVGSSYFFYQHSEYPRDCHEVYAQCSATNSSGVYLIKPDGYPNAFEVFCDNSIDGGGWTVFQRRVDGSIYFNRTWKEYKNGFGFQSNEFWLGLEKLSFLTNQKKYEVRINMENTAGLAFHVQYNVFRISDEYGDFRIIAVGEYSGTADNYIVFCPTNMEYGNCTCQATCEDPENVMECQTSCTEEETCICREGFLKKGEDCVPPSSCSCYMEEEGVIPNEQSRVNFDCTSRCQCQANVLTCDNTYACSSDATCEERDGVNQCYCNDGYTGDGQTCEVVATDCADIYNAGITDSGVYTIKPTDWTGSPFEVYCNMTDGGGWTVFQRRVNGSEDFYLGWNSYRDGFGSPNHELWLGNDKISNMTNHRNYQLRIDMVDRNGSPYYAKYDLFRISDENDNYKLVGLGSYTGNAGYDSMNWHRNRPFSTRDTDNDGWNDYHCAERNRGGWWYGQGYTYTGSYCKTSEGYCDYWPLGSNSCGWCAYSNLNGDYDSQTRGTNIHWSGLSGYDCNIVYTEMKIKPV
ncbi:Ficolin-1 [Holothuria leucospilota]|uniref:Ficolin-1 n=1 Tax=Holothuria leucospilota TaxID=206669 RepID=A0A9Q1H5W3_HOLLE|nr:Ficolin-1 [Holothuria leucospilota]